MSHCSVAFEHALTPNTLKCVKTNYSTDTQYGNENDIGTTFSDLFEKDSMNSRIISLQTLNIINNRLQIDLACVIWSLADKNGSSSSFFLSIFNLNNWYIQCMPSKMRALNESLNRKNIYFTNYTLALNNEIDDIKVKV